jgi:putative transposase
MSLAPQSFGAGVSHAFNAASGMRLQSVSVKFSPHNGRRSHSSLDRRTPDQAYFTPLPIRMAA